MRQPVTMGEQRRQDGSRVPRHATRTVVAYPPQVTRSRRSRGNLNKQARINKSYLKRQASVCLAVRGTSQRAQEDSFPLPPPCPGTPLSLAPSTNPRFLPARRSTSPRRARTEWISNRPAARARAPTPPGIILPRAY